jgi:hypothetical protein
VNASPTPPPEPAAADKAAAHAFLAELNTRITTQPLPYQYGDEETALKSLRDVFDHARAAIKENQGCKIFTAAVTKMLNEELRPVTAKWHRALTQGVLNSRDGADEFRGDLALVQVRLRKFATQLQLMAYGEKLPEIRPPAVMPKAELDRCLADVAFGISEVPPSAAVAAQTIRAINADERDAIRLKRRHGADFRPVNAVGLALSGGGIRSATFCLGVVQVLADRGLFKHIDFLSTVSGGGYTGSFLTARLGDVSPATPGAADDGIAHPDGPDPEPIRYLRTHAKYLTAIDLKDRWTMVTAALAGMVLNWSAVVLLAALAAFAAAALSRSFPGDIGWWPVATAVSGFFTAILLLLYGWLMRKRDAVARCSGDWLGALTAFTALLAAGWLIALGHRFVPAWIAAHWIKGGLVGALAVAGPTIMRFVPIFEKPLVRKIALQVLLWGAALLVPLGALALFYAFWGLAEIGISSGSGAGGNFIFHYVDGMVVLFAIIVVAAIAVAALNINLTGPHRLYRDRLAATFIQKREGAPLTMPLTGINPRHSAPYHLINTALNLPSSTAPALRDRRCDFFLFSKRWCGSTVVGYRRTAEWQTNAAPADLATAMAISGAAIAPSMGLGSMTSLRSLMTFLNVRLGFWIRNPAKPGGQQTPGFSCLVQEMFGIAMSETAPWLNLSDGGHIENMGAYELLRRRCKFIICVDGESDPEYTFKGFMTLARHAQIDFGVGIESSLGDLKPDPKTGLSRVHAVLCQIHYPDGGAGRPKATGLLLYLKLSVTGNEGELIKRYRITHPEFPHQTTLDQFFDEEQFEAYRQLGAHAAKGLFSRALMNGNTDPASVAIWFRQLAASLFRPAAP